MDYMGTIKRGWNLTWNNKYLWILGFLAALGGGISSTSNYQFNSGDFGSTSPQLTPALTGGIILLGCVFFIIGILLWLVSLASRGGLITAADDLEKGQTSSFGQAFRQGWRKVLPLAGMTILLFAVLIILIMILVFAFAGTIAGAIAAGNSDNQGIAAILGSLGLVALCLLCIMVPLGIVLNLIYPFAYRGMMLRNLGVMDAIRHGWQVLRANLGEILLLGLLFFVINLVISFVVGSIVAVLGIGGGLLSLLLTGGEITTAQMIAGGVGLLVVMLIFAAINAVITAWRSATFTLAYNQWMGGKGADVVKDTAAPLPSA